MYIAVEGCGHGELDGIYSAVQSIERTRGISVDMLIICGDFQSVRNPDDLQCMAVPPKYYTMGTFYKYYSGEVKAPILTLVVGGNHEASNYLQSLAYGGWLAPNIYFVGYASVLRFGSLRIGSMSGIYKGADYMKGHFECPPYNGSSMRSAYHVRNTDTFRLKQLTPGVDIFLSHDWPRGIYHHGNVRQLLTKKPFFKEEIETDKLGSRPAEEVLRRVKPHYWFAAHLHVKFSALFPHEGGDAEGKSDGARDNSECKEDGSTAKEGASVTRFLALDKCLPKRRYLQVLELGEGSPELHYDLEWLTVLRLTDHLTSISPQAQYMPGPGSDERFDFRPTAAELEATSRLWGEDLRVPHDFMPTVVPYDGRSNIRNGRQPPAAPDPQTVRFCRKLGIRDPMQMLCGNAPAAATPTRLPMPLRRAGPEECDVTLENGGDVTMDPDAGDVTLNDTVDSSGEGDTTADDDMFMIDRKGTNARHSQSFAMKLTSPRNQSGFTSTPVKPRMDDLSEFVPLEEPGFSSREATPKTPAPEARADVTPGSTPSAKKFKRRNQAIYAAEPAD